MFSEKYADKEKLKKSIQSSFSMVRPLSDRAYWEGIKETAIDQVSDYISSIDGFDFTLPASLYLEYVRNGNRTRYEAVCFERRKALTAFALLEAMENKGNYIDKVLDFTWMILEETTWCIPAHGDLRPESDGLPNDEHPSLDLFQAETGCTLSFVFSLFGETFETISKNIVPRLKREINFRVIDNFLIHNDYWWQGFQIRENENGKRYVVNNWNPWILSNVLLCAATIAESADRLYSVVEKVMKSLDNYADTYPQDGACDEGPSYWNRAGLSLLDCAYLLYKITGGYVNEFDNEKIKNTAEYIAKVHIGNGYFVNFADCAPHLTANYGTTYKYGKLMGSETMVSFAKTCFENDKSSTFSLWQMPRGLELYEAIPKLSRLSAPSRAFRDVYFSSTQVIACRETDACSGLFLAAKGGHNDESHNHNDVGSFIVYKDSEPFLIDPGNEAYCAKTFSDKRYEIWNNRSCFHNLPAINEKEQSAGFDFCASDVTYLADAEETVFSLDIKNAYENRNEIKKWKRTFKLSRKEKEITITEDFELSVPSEIVLNLMTVCNVKITPYRLLFTADSGKTLTLHADLSQFDVGCETIDTTDSKMLADWGKAPTRVQLKLKSKTDKGIFTFKIK